MMSSQVEVVIVWREQMNRSQSNMTGKYSGNWTSCFINVINALKKLIWGYTILPHQHHRNVHVWVQKTQCNVYVLGSTSANLDFVFDLPRVWTGQTVAFSWAWPTFLTHCNSMWFVNSLRCRVRSNTHKQPSVSPQGELDSQHLKQDQLYHTFKNKSTVYKSGSFLENVCRVVDSSS